MPASTHARLSPSTGRPRASSLGAAHPATDASARRLGNRATGRLLDGAPLRMGRSDTAHEGQAHAFADSLIAGRPAPAQTAARAGTLPVPAKAQALIAASQGGGRPVDGEIKAQVAPAIGATASRARVHTDDRAHTLATELGAAALTVGHDIFFRRGHYRPETERGRQMVFHELGHAKQQERGERVVQRTEYTWDGQGWATGSGRRQMRSPLVLRDIGPGYTVGDKWSTETRVLSHVGGGQRHILPRADREANEVTRRKRIGAKAALRYCDTLALVASKLDEIGYDASTLPTQYLRKTDEFRRMKAMVGQRKKFKALRKAGETLPLVEVAARLALRDGVSEALDDDALYTYLVAAKKRMKTVDASFALLDTLEWNTTAGQNNFSAWAGGQRSRKPDKMNCWEAVLWAAHKAGYLSRETIAEKYAEVEDFKSGAKSPARAIDDADRPIGDKGARDAWPIIAIEELLTQGPPRRYSPNATGSARPLKGDIVLFGRAQDHVSLAEGNSEGPVQITSLWYLNSMQVERTTVEKLLERTHSPYVWFYRPSWA